LPIQKKHAICEQIQQFAQNLHLSNTNKPIKTANTNNMQFVKFSLFSPTQEGLMEP